MADTVSFPVPFDPLNFLLVLARTFEQLEIGEVFRAPSCTLTDAHSAAFQTVSCNNHPVHYNAEWAKRRGHSAPVVHGSQILAFTARGPRCFHTSLVRHSAPSELSCQFLGEVRAGATLYPALRITDLIPQGATGTVVTAATVHNQRGELVLSGQHKYLLRTTPAA